MDSWNIPYKWNLYETEGPRTNNHLEGCYNHLRRVVGKSHTNIFEKDQHIEELKERFSSNIISLSDNVAAMSQHINL